jgi:hypothetical protein
VEPSVPALSAGSAFRAEFQVQAISIEIPRLTRTLFAL